MGSPNFAVPSLQNLIDSHHNVLAVFCQPPRPSGRGHKTQKTPVHILADKHNIPVHTPLKLDADAQQIIQNYNPNIICVAAYGMLLPQEVLNIAPCINVHPSALPRWRGAAPLHHTILSGDKTTDICIMEMEKGLDSGAVYLRKTYAIAENETTGELHNRLSTAGGKLLTEVLNNWPSKATPQAKIGLTYAHKFKPSELKQVRALNFNAPAKAVHNQICGLSPWPGATATHNNITLKILGSKISNQTGHAGQILAINNDRIIIACKEGSITLTKLQKPGKQAMKTSDFIKGYPLEVGDSFE